MKQADRMADLLNNIVGRQIAADNPHGTTTDLAKRIASYFKENGLFVATVSTDGSVKVAQKAVGDQKLIKALEVLGTLNNLGFTQAEQEQREEQRGRASRQRQLR